MSRAGYGDTWWGRAWIDALERTASLDPSRLSRGRTYARNGSVGPLEITPGLVSTRVSGTHGRYYRTDVAVKRLAAVEWDQVVDAIAAKASHAAALLDGDLDPGIVADAAELDVRLLPGPGDLRPDCSCPDWAEPCKHAAAVCFLVATELDRDPFLLFLLRGMPRDELLSRVRDRRRGQGSEPEAESLPGVDAVVAWGGRRPGDPIGDPPDVVVAPRRHAAAPGYRPPWEAKLPAELGVDTRRVDALADDAIWRAWLMISDGAPSGLASAHDADVARRAAALDGPRQRGALADTVGIPRERLDALAEAWTLGGDEGVDVLAEIDRVWSTDQTALAAGRDELVGLGWSKRSVALNYDSLGMRNGVLLVIAPSGRWFKLRMRGARQGLHLEAPPTADVCDLVDPPPPGAG